MLDLTETVEIQTTPLFAALMRYFWKIDSNEHGLLQNVFAF